MNAWKPSILALSLVIGLSACSSGSSEESSVSVAATNTGTPSNAAANNTAQSTTQSNQSQTNGTTTTANNQAATVDKNQQPTVSNTQAASNSAVTTTSQNTPNQAVNVANAEKSGEFTGFAYKFGSGDAVKEIKNAHLLTLSSEARNILYIDGQKIELAPLMPGYTLQSTDNSIVMSLGSFVNGADYMPNTQFGVFADKKNNNTYVFVQGKATPVADMPIEGLARYTGLSAYHVTNSTLNASQWAVYGVDLTADFKEKTLKGNLLMTGVPAIPIDTKISGNQFSSDARSDNQVKGQFYGDKAKELGGVYVNEKEGYAGAFSARQW